MAHGSAHPYEPLSPARITCAVAPPTFVSVYFCTRRDTATCVPPNRLQGALLHHAFPRDLHPVHTRRPNLYTVRVASLTESVRRNMSRTSAFLRLGSNDVGASSAARRGGARPPG